MQPESPEVHRDPEQAGPDPGPAAGETVAEPTGATIAELEDRLRRALADLDNVRKRHARDLDRERAAAANRAAAAWLPVLDNLDLALDHAGADPSAIIDGVRAIRDQALDVLASLGFSRYDEVGVPFDPARHEAMMSKESSTAEPNSVLQVVQPGYELNGRLLRPARVIVARSSAAGG